jgi:hypothetical protein
MSMNQSITSTSVNMKIGTKMCRFMYTGCTDVNCTFAHSERECRAPRGLSQAMQGVRFAMPENMPTPAGISFILRLPNDSDDEEDDIPSPSLSLSQLSNAMMSPHYSLIKTEFLRNEFEKAKKSRGVFMALHSAQQNKMEGECDMDLSE